MIAMLLMGIVLTVFASLVQEYSRILRASQGSEALLEARQLILGQLAPDIEQAVTITSPSGTASSTLEIVKFNPGVTRLPVPAEPPPATWDPRAAADLITVRYLVTGGILTRQVGGQTTPLLEVDGFSCQRLADGNVRLTVSIQTETRLVPLDLLVRPLVAP